MNQRLIYLHASGYGPSGPYAARPLYAQEAAALNGIKGWQQVLRRRRGFRDDVEPTLLANNIDRETLDAMHEAVIAALPDFRRYLRAKARALGVGRLAWYDINAFAGAPIGRFGTAARGDIEGPSLNVWHAGLHKSFRLTDRPGAPTLRIELTTTNVFNTAQWQNPNLNVTPTNVSAAKVTAVGGAAGSIQQANMRRARLGFRLAW